MPRYLFLFLPAAAHVASSLPIAAELMARGAEVVYYTPAEFEPWINAIGADTRIIRLDERHPPAQWDYPQISPLVLLYTYLLRQSLYVLPQIVNTLPDEQADYIVYDGMCLWARFVTQLLRIPAITVRTSFAATFQHNIFREFLKDDSGASLEDQQEMMEKNKILGAVIKETYGLSVPGAWSTFTHAGRLNIVLVPRELHPSADSFDDRFVFVGPSFVGPRPMVVADGERVSIDQASDEPLVYVSFGTSELNTNLDLYKACFEGLGGLPLRVIMAYGTNINPARLGTVPDNFQIASRVPQFTVLERVDVFISHAGLCSTMESLYHGVPMVVIPMMEEHAIIAKIVADRGAAITLDPSTFSAWELKAAVDQLLSNNTYRQKAACLRGVIRACGGYKQAADVIMHRQQYLNFVC